jgi:uncharacterized protein (DUF58 family)
MSLRYRVKITRGGYIYIVLTVVMAVGGVNTGNNLLYLISSVMLAGMLVSGLSSVVNLAGLKPRVIPPKEVFAGIETPFLVQLERRLPVIPSVLVRVTLEGGSEGGCFVSAKEPAKVRVWLTFEKRGAFHLKQLGLSSGFPFGFFVRTRQIPVDLDVVVFPHPLPASVVGAGQEGRGDLSSLAESGVGDEVFGLREYREGDPPRYLDWKASARRGAPVVKEMASNTGDELLIRVSPGATEEDLGRATYLVIEGLRRGYRVGMDLGDEHFAPGVGDDHKKRILTALALR